tara:strand:+ start:986 stop:1234 length:249 start_codon:yes stop_codon:yes gene_type:complete
MKQKTKKLFQGHYLHLETNKHISSCVGENYTTWNIWNDATLCDEFAIGFNTKWQAVKYLDRCAEEKRNVSNSIKALREYRQG